MQLQIDASQSQPTISINGKWPEQVNPISVYRVTIEIKRHSIRPRPEARRDLKNYSHKRENFQIGVKRLA